MQVKVSLQDGSLKVTDDLLQSVSDIKAGWREVETYIDEREREIFRTRNHGEWPALKRATVRQKGNSQVLVDTGSLLASLTSKAAQYGSLTLQGDTLTIAASQPYAGFARGRGRDPLPPLLPPEQERVAELMLNHLLSAAGTAGVASARAALS